MRKFITLILSCSCLLFLTASRSVQAESIQDLPFEGYYMAEEDYPVHGLLFEDNQLFIYLNTDLHDEPTKGLDFLALLEEIHSFPFPEMTNYNSDVVSDAYNATYNLDHDIKASYEKVTAQITPEMTHANVIHMINNEIPGIYYTEKQGFEYYTLAAPMVTIVDDSYQISLFGRDIMTLTQGEAASQIISEDGTAYNYVLGFRP